MEGEDITPEEVLGKLEEGEDVASSQPSPESLINMFDMILNEKGYDELVYIPMSSTLSGSYDMASSFARLYDGKVQVVDNRRISVSLMCSVFDAVTLTERGYNARQIKKKLEDEASNQSIYITLPTVRRLVKTGRITPKGAALAGLLHIKPILSIANGKIDAFSRTRGMKMAENIMIDAIKKDKLVHFKEVSLKKLRLFVANTYIHEGPGELWRKKVLGRFPEFDKVESFILPASICVHVGANLEGIGIVEVL